MLQIRNTERLTRYTEARSTAISPGDLLASLSVLVFSLYVMCGAIYLFVAAPKVLAQSEIVIDAQKTQLFRQQSVYAKPIADHEQSRRIGIVS
jgi:uncharacterized protein involved in exopolysaccharide biosynthesis